MRTQNINRSNVNTKNTSVTLAEAMEAFIQRKVDEFDITTSSAKRYRITARFFEGLADRPIDELTPDEIRLYIRSKAPFSKHEVKAAVNLLRGTFRLAVELDWVTKDVTYNIQPREFFKLCLPRTEKAPLSDTAIVRIKEDAHEHTPDMRAYAILMSIETGMRSGEIVALKWEDVGDDYIHVHRRQCPARDDLGHIVGTEDLLYTNENPHVSQERFFPVTPAIRVLLEEIRAYTGDCEYVLNENGGPITTRSYEQYLRRRTKNLGYDGVNNHMLRKTLTNTMVSRCSNAMDRALLLGSCSRTNTNYYCTHIV